MDIAMNKSLYVSPQVRPVRLSGDLRICEISATVTQSYEVDEIQIWE